jgi:hypothetical protein
VGSLCLGALVLCVEWVELMARRLRVNLRDCSRENGVMETWHHGALGDRETLGHISVAGSGNPVSLVLVGKPLDDMYKRLAMLRVKRYFQNSSTKRSHVIQTNGYLYRTGCCGRWHRRKTLSRNGEF